MMKKTLMFIIGFAGGAAISIVLLYATGLVLQSMDIQLYASESDQQRNFNIFIVTGLVISMLSGFFTMRKFT